ncbi:tumor protein p53-inducible protein 11-like [Stegostoma tigrinum]|uniref:tumor protein p53-inducible protein 11-like n=1 Tax=Stegostoma tigrinum TaxID=3053191 RepID=UPI00202B4157|nr:tumor protein p53-inducible protein 11-like [Stegostoma tigrinum]XP_048377596.1 tumor protein p53-inducible protein 11-like [Stegostoma tigrinum]XP_059496409.1 tumor protein p53-inducible protein 11-like [Stegostoma tigrinum]XP_059496410.1 tumor protein p53-inducible protein 11-like [Stegostoma tigrinum]XP_059496411.1 tumor protein p53-inducible protein 11-like [Stegostoma tigrinum]XP_059496412.1 tumor protein p53-inducible protein 11-like [Stegostoma tigrinum]XP_059496413.1 tumor protein 
MAVKPHGSLLKKHSQTDLVSRLKSRKILGVGGEDDEGEVHRSKISQMLGNEFKFALHEPFGLRYWQFISAVIFSVAGILALVFPRMLHSWLFHGDYKFSCIASLRLHSGALLSIALILWNAFYTSEKAIIRWTLLSETCYFVVEFLVTLVSAMDQGLFSQDVGFLLLSCAIFGVLSLFYYLQVGRKPKKI